MMKTALNGFLLVLFTASCSTLRAQTTQPAGMDPDTAHLAKVTIEKVPYEGFEEAYKLSNQTVEVIVVPDIGRVMHYGFKDGGQNVLWTDVAGARTTGAGQWANWGGDKVWPWPQDNWPQTIGRGWPPPNSDSAPYEAEVVGDDTLRLTLPAIDQYGVTLTRDIRLDREGTRVTIDNRFEKTDDTKVPMAVWTITQVPHPGYVIARRVGGSPLEYGYKQMNETEWTGITGDGNDLLIITPPDEGSRKIGLDADLLAWVNDDVVFVTRMVPPGQDAGEFVPGDRAQVYSEPRYVELEYTMPVVELEKGQSQELQQVLEMRKLEGERKSEEWIKEFIRGF